MRGTTKDGDVVSYRLGESADAPLARDTSLLSLDSSPVTGDFETPTAHPTHFIRMGWDSFIWKEGPPRPTC